MMSYLYFNKKDDFVLSRPNEFNKTNIKSNAYVSQAEYSHQLSEQTCVYKGGSWLWASSVLYYYWVIMSSLDY